jgi:hypothetical protein
MDRVKRKLADVYTKLERICTKTGNKAKLKALLESNKGLDVNRIRLVSFVLLAATFSLIYTN